MRTDELQRRARAFHDAYFRRGGSNRFEDLAEEGQRAYDELLGALACPEAEERIDALVMLGRLFASHGCTPEALRAVVEHGKSIRESGIGPERHAALFAMGRSGEASLLDSFVTVLAAGDSGRAEVACYAVGYGRWQSALPFLLLLAKSGDRKVAPAAIWALGQLRSPDALATLLPMLERGEQAEWVIGALGDIGDARALEPLAQRLAGDVPDIKLISAAAMWAIIDNVSDRKERRRLLSLEPALRRAAGDAYAPVAAFALLSLAALGASVTAPELERTFGTASPASTELAGSERFFLSRRHI